MTFYGYSEYNMNVQKMANLKQIIDMVWVVWNRLCYPHPIA